MARPDPPTRRRLAATLAALAVALAACSGPDADRSARGGPDVVAGPDLALAASLQPFDACGDVLAWFQREALARVGPFGLPANDGDLLFPAGSGGAVPDLATARTSDGAESAGPPVSAGADRAFSTTNVQETGVDEPDVVKTDGRRVYAVAGHQLRVLDVTGRSPTLLGRLGLPGEGTTRLLLDGDRVLAVDDDAYGLFELGTADARGGMSVPRTTRPLTRLTLVDVADPTRPEVLTSVVVEGRHVDVRLVGGRARVVTSSGVGRLPVVMPSDTSAEAIDLARRTNEDSIRRSTVEDWLPIWRDGDAPGDAEGEPLVACERLRHPKEFSGFGTLSVLSLDLQGDALDLSDSVGLVAGGQIAYASDRHLYVATTKVDDPVREDPPTPGTTPGTTPSTAIAPDDEAPGRRLPPPPVLRTAVHAFSITEPGPASYRASGLVDGTVKDRWSLSEHEGHLRVVTTTSTDGTASQVSVLTERDGGLVVVGTAGDMGRGEAVKAVRFHGDVGYVVTFRQIDPFYVLDLATPTDPRVVGELKMPGYSAYLHPVGDGRVLGVGQDADERGIPRGMKLSLFDVSDPARPTELTQQILPGTSSEVETDSRAFLWWEPTGLAVVPTRVHQPFPGDGRPSGPSPTVAVGFRVAPDALTAAGRIDLDPTARPDGTPVRSVVVDDAVVTVTGSGVRTSELDTLEARAWLAL